MPSDAPHTLSPLGWCLTTTFGLGTLRPAPGTWGSLPPPALAFLFVLLGISSTIFHATFIAIAIVFSVGCVAFGRAAEARFGKKDPGSVCADETAGMCLPLLFLPAASLAGWPSAMLTLGGAFIAFRVFDILKLWPANGLQRLGGGWGILLDDLVAGLQAALVVQLVTRLI